MILKKQIHVAIINKIVRISFSVIYLVIVGLGLVHHSSDSIVNDGFPHNSPLGDWDPIPGLLSVRIKHKLESTPKIFT